jgi:hypothetical protein
MISRRLLVLSLGLLLISHADATPAQITVVELKNHTKEAIALEVSFDHSLSFRFGSADVTFKSPDWGLSQANRIRRLVDVSAMVLESGERLGLFEFFSTDFTTRTGPRSIIPQVLDQLHVRDRRGRTLMAHSDLEAIHVEVEEYSTVETVWRITIGDLQVLHRRADPPESRSYGNEPNQTEQSGYERSHPLAGAATQGPDWLDERHGADHDK